jgi:hypothetical protein
MKKIQLTPNDQGELEEALLILYREISYLDSLPREFISDAKMEEIESIHNDFAKMETILLDAIVTGEIDEDIFFSVFPNPKGKI